MHKHKKKKRYFKKRYILWTLGGGFLIILILAHLFLTFRMSDAQTIVAFKNLKYQPSIKYYETAEHKIRYVEVGKKTKRMIVFVHGAPGSSSAFIDYLKDKDLLEKFYMISVDRPGYGYSGFGKSVISIEKQAKMLKPLLEMNQHEEPPILVGHSYGGPIIARMAMDYPKLTGPLLMFAPAIDPDNEVIYSISYPLDWAIFHWIMPKAICVSNDEKLSHVAELKKMIPLWKNIKNPTTFVHGEKDGLVPIANSKYGQKMMKQASVKTVFIEDMNHLMIFNRFEFCKKQILKTLDTK